MMVSFMTSIEPLQAADWLYSHSPSTSALADVTGVIQAKIATGRYIQNPLRSLSTNHYSALSFTIYLMGKPHALILPLLP